MGWGAFLHLKVAMVPDGLWGEAWFGEQILDMGGCQNDGLFLDPYYNTAPNI